MKRLLLLTLVSALLVLIVAACQQQQDPADVVEAYFTALVEHNDERVRSLSCAAWEANANTQLQSFRTVEVGLPGMSCTAGGTDGDYTLVDCEGTMSILYGGEQRDFPLERYRVIQEAGDWRFCGEG